MGVGHGSAKHSRGQIMGAGGGAKQGSLCYKNFKVAITLSYMAIKHGGSASSWEKGAQDHGRRECQFMGGESASSWQKGALVHGKRVGQTKALTMLQVSYMTIKHEGSASSWQKGALVHWRREHQFMGGGRGRARLSLCYK